jgi:deoxyribonuclease-4
MWRPAPPDALQVRLFRQTRERLDLAPLAVHDCYLINLAAAEGNLRARSIAAFRVEIQRALTIGADYLVAHPGSCGSQGPEQGVRTLAASLAQATRGIDTGGLTILLENTAGAGAQLGGSFGELRAIREAAVARADIHIGYCLDTAHCLAFGYDVATEEGLRRTVREAGRILGLEHVKLIHANDSKTPLGSRVDRHQHIGRGFIGRAGFRRILHHPKLRAKPFILETPIDRPGDDRRNMLALKRLSRA